MDLRRKSKKGITGIEAAIVMIAFVVVAAALAFVVLNMGMFTTQKAKEAIQTGLEGATSALQVDGSTAALVSANSKVDLIAVPVKLAPGKQAVDLGVNRTSISVLIADENIALENAYAGAIYVDGSKVYLSNTNGTYDITANLSATQINNLTAIADYISKTNPSGPVVYVVFIKDVKPDTVLQNGEKALVIVYLPSNYALGSYASISIEVRPPAGAPLTIDRTMPATLPANSVITLG